MIRRSVVLPQPDGPRQAQTSPCAQAEGDVVENDARLAGSGPQRLLRYKNFKRHAAAASARHAVQRVAR